MNRLRYILLYASFWAANLSGYGQFVNISLFNEFPVKSVVVSILKGTYRIYGDSSLKINQSENDIIYISMFEQRLLLRNSQKPIGIFTNIKFETVDTNGIFRLNLVNPHSESRQYNDNLLVSVAFGRVLLMNEVQPDNYIAGVVDAEAGPNAEPEFYKAQSILVRTFLYANIDRHRTEGFQVCDGVHCQAYNGISDRNPAVAEATKATSGLVIIAQDSSLITAAFHANCGGETESAANAWLNDKSYLASVKDPFCQNSSSARWTKSIPLDQWKKYLKGHSFKFPNTISPGDFDFSQINRKQYYKIGRDSIPVKQIRNDFQLKSSFFSIVATSKEIAIKGRGFGHGVGLCQDGAMYMAKIGYKADEILMFYYKGIKIVNYSASASLDKANR